MKKLFNNKRIELTEIQEVATSWGYHYSLYIDGQGNYYITADDTSDEVIAFAVKEDAIAEFKEYMNELEEGMTDDEI